MLVVSFVGSIQNARGVVGSRKQSVLKVIRSGPLKMSALNI